jgi:hypothetical protein
MRVVAQTMPNSPPLASASPGMSSRTCAPRLSLRKRGASTAAASPTGTLIQKIQCQPSVFTSTPPSRGPSATPSPEMDDHMPSAAVRRSSGKADESSVSVSGIRSAAPRPWKVRATTSWVRVSESAPAADEAVNTSSPITSMRLRP